MKYWHKLNMTPGAVNTDTSQANWLTGLKLRLRKKWHNLPG
jgi:glycine cleavage system H lipoate-binding protein